MNKKGILIALALCSFIFPSLSFAEIYSAEATMTLPEYNPNSVGHFAPIEVFIGTPNKPFKEMGLIKVIGSRNADDQEFIDALKDKAKEINVDGVSNIQFAVEPGHIL